jgi:hypothetical protein
MAAHVTLTRRTLLKSAAGAAVGAPYVLTTAALGSGGTPPASERVGCAVFGLGDRGPSHIGMARRDGQLVAVCDPWQDRRDRHAKANDVPGYGDFREVLARPDVDAVFLAVPDHWHVPLAIAAARAGKDVYCEKALGLTIEQDLALWKVLKETGRVFQYGPQRRESGQFRHACELVRNGRTGQVREVHVTAMTFGPCAPKAGYQPSPPPPQLDYDLWLGPAPDAPYVPGRCKARGWYTIYDYCLGWISAWGSHILSILVWGWDAHKAGQVEVEGTGDIPNDGLNDNAVRWDVRFQFSNGVRMTLGTAHNGVKFVGTEGWVVAGDKGFQTGPEDLWKTEIRAEEVHLGSGSLGGNFLSCVKTRGRTISPIDQAVYSDVLSHLADIAIRLGRKVTFDFETFRFPGDDEADRLRARAMRAPWRL